MGQIAPALLAVVTPAQNGGKGKKEQADLDDHAPYGTRQDRVEGGHCGGAIGGIAVQELVTPIVPAPCPSETRQLVAMTSPTETEITLLSPNFFSSINRPPSPTTLFRPHHQCGHG